SLAFSPDSKTLATGGYDDNRDPVVQLWDVASGQLKATLKPSLNYLDSLAFSADGKTLATGGPGENSPRAVLLWDLPTGQLKAVLKGASRDSGYDTAYYRAPLAFSPDGRTLATTSADDNSQVLFWDVASKQVRATLRGHQDTVAALAFSPDGK